MNVLQQWLAEEEQSFCSLPVRRPGPQDKRALCLRVLIPLSRQILQCTQTNRWLAKNAVKTWASRVMCLVADERNADDFVILWVLFFRSAQSEISAPALARHPCVPSINYTFPIIRKVFAGLRPMDQHTFLTYNREFHGIRVLSEL